MPVLRTPRLVLREWRDDDRAPFAALNADPAVMAHFPRLLTRDESDAAVDRIIAHFAREGFGMWALETANASFIGFTGLARPAFRPDVVEVGWRIARPFWGQGLAIEAARAAVAWGFETLKLAEIVAWTAPSNTPSQRVMAKLGMKRDPDADFDHPVVPAGHPLNPHWLYRLARTG